MGKRNHILDRNEMEKLKWLVKKKQQTRKEKDTIRKNRAVAGKKYCDAPSE